MTVDYDFEAAHSVLTNVAPDVKKVIEAAQNVVRVQLAAMEEDNWLGNQDLGWSMDMLIEAFSIDLPQKCEECGDYTDQGETAEGVYCSGCKEKEGIL